MKPIYKTAFVASALTFMVCTSAHSQGLFDVIKKARDAAQNLDGQDPSQDNQNHIKSDGTPFGPNGNSGSNFGSTPQDSGVYIDPKFSHSVTSNTPGNAWVYLTATYGGNGESTGQVERRVVSSNTDCNVMVNREMREWQTPVAKYDADSTSSVLIDHNYTGYTWFICVTVDNYRSKGFDTVVSERMTKKRALQLTRTPVVNHVPDAPGSKRGKSVTF